MKTAILAACALGALAAAGGAQAQPGNIDPAARFAWSENAGYLNFRDAQGGAAGVVVHQGWLSGKAWCENLGWLDFGDGLPANGSAYANNGPADFGVNLSLDTGNLSGYAWGENIGWVNFNTGSLGGQRAKFFPAVHEFSGFAWAENVGWLALGAVTPVLAASEPLTDLGFGLAGSGGKVPLLTAYGNTGAGATFVLQVRQAKALSLLYLFYGLNALPSPFKGGTLVPVPYLGFTTFPADASGNFALTLPGGLSPLAIDIVMQVVVPDGGAPQGYAMSNAIRLHLVP